MWRRLLILTTKRSREPIAALVWFLALTAWALHSPVTMTAQTLTTLYNFQGPPTDGMAPGTGVVRDHNGNMYGTTSAGGQSEMELRLKSMPVAQKSCCTASNSS